MKAAVYLRVSSDEQATHGHSIAFQREECTERALSLGAQKVLEYNDEGVSGAVLERPSLDSLRKAVRSGEIDTVIVWDPDRLARNLAHQLLLTEEIEAKSRLVFVRFERDNTPEGELFFQLRGAIAQYEREKIRERTAAGRRQKARAGKLPFAVGPYGYRYEREKSTLVVVEEEARVVKRLFDDYVNLKGGLNGLAKRLTEEGIPTPRRVGAWHRETIRQIIRNSVYKGVYYANRRDMTGCGLNRYRKEGKVWGRERPPEQWIPIEVPAIIDEATWERAQEVMLRARNLWCGSASKYLLSGLIRCGVCGLSMTGKRQNSWGRKVRYYTCRKNTAGAKNRGCPRYMKADQIEAAVWRVVRGWVPEVDEIGDLLHGEEGDNALARELVHVERQLANVRQCKRKVLMALERGLVNDEDALDTLNALAEREHLLTGERASLEETLSASELLTEEELTLMIGEALEHGMPLEKKREILRQFVVGIVVGEESVRVRARIPEFSAGISQEEGDLDVPESH